MPKKSKQVRAAHAKDMRTGLDGCESLQHRHLSAIAAMIASLPGDAGSRKLIAEHFESQIARRNGRFDSGRFLAACLVNGPGD